MIPIKKGAAPRELKQNVALLRSNPQTPATYAILRKDAKSAVLHSLLEEQGYLCAYCMRRIGENSDAGATIEHIIPQRDINGTRHDKESLDYGNMLAVCNGGMPSDGRHVTPSVLTCDKHRGNAPMTVNPLKPHTLSSIKYRGNGVIYSTDSQVDHDLNETLNLNSELAPQRFGRKAVIDEVNAYLTREFKSRGIDHDRKAKKAFCQRQLARASKPWQKKDEYIGVLIFQLEKFISKFS